MLLHVFFTSRKATKFAKTLFFCAFSGYNINQRKVLQLNCGTIETNGAATEYFTFGHGSKHLVILPGLSTRSILYAAMSIPSGYRIFSEDYTVWVIDRRASMPEHFTVRQMAADIAAAMRGLGIGTADVFGASLGGMTAQYLAADCPELVHALVLGSTTARQNPTILRVSVHWAEAARNGTLAEHTEEMMRLLYSPATIEKYGKLLCRVNDGLSREELHRFAVQARAISDFNGYAVLDRIHCPTLVIGVEGDKVVTAEASMEIAEKLGCGCYIYGREYGHCVFDEAPDYKQRLFDFFRSTWNAEK